MGDAHLKSTMPTLFSKEITLDGGDQGGTQRARDSPSQQMSLKSKLRRAGGCKFPPKPSKYEFPRRINKKSPLNITGKPPFSEPCGYATTLVLLAMRKPCDHRFSGPHSVSTNEQRARGLTNGPSGLHAGRKLCTSGIRNRKPGLLLLQNYCKGFIKAHPKARHSKGHLITISFYIFPLL